MEFENTITHPFTFGETVLLIFGAFMFGLIIGWVLKTTDNNTKQNKPFDKNSLIEKAQKQLKKGTFKHFEN